MVKVALAIGADTICTKQRRERIVERILNLPGNTVIWKILISKTYNSNQYNQKPLCGASHLKQLKLTKQVGYKHLKYAGKIREVLKLDEEMKDFARSLISEQSLLMFGRGYNYATALEGALKVKEVGLMHSEGILANKMKHWSVGFSLRKPSHCCYCYSWSMLEVRLIISIIRNSFTTNFAILTLICYFWSANIIQLFNNLRREKVDWLWCVQKEMRLRYAVCLAE